MTHPCDMCPHPEEDHSLDPATKIAWCTVCHDEFEPLHEWENSYPMRECLICGLVEEAPEPDYGDEYDT